MKNSKSLSEQQRDLVQEFCTHLSGKIFYWDCSKSQRKGEKEEVWEMLKNANLLFGVRVPFSEEMKDHFFNGLYIERVLLSDFLKVYQESEDLYFCSLGNWANGFSHFWSDEVGMQQCKRIANLFIKKEYFFEQNSVREKGKYLFYTDIDTPKNIRVLLLKWCIKKGIKYLDELFLSTTLRKLSQ